MRKVSCVLSLAGICVSRRPRGDPVIRPSSFRRTCSVIALSAVALAACASHNDRAAPRRHVSIKDDPADAPPQPDRSPRAQRASHVMGAPDRQVQMAAPSSQPARPEPNSGSDQPSKSVAREPSPVLPKIGQTPPTLPVIVEAPIDKPKPAAETPPLARSAALDPRTVTQPKPAEVQPAPIEQPKTSVATPEPPAQAQPSRPVVVIKSAETAPQPDSRPITETRRRATPEAVSPPRNSAVPLPATAPPVVVAVPAPIVQAAQPPQPPTKVEAKADPKVATLTDDQRVASTLSRVDGYMKSGAFQNARTLLEDAAKSGNPKLLTALAETYDPLVLREQYPKLARTGDPEKAIALYEHATAKGATHVAARVAALKILAGAKR